LADVGGAIGLGFLVVGIPVATVIAITKYRLYDVDLVINNARVAAQVARAF